MPKNWYIAAIGGNDRDRAALEFYLVGVETAVAGATWGLPG